MSSSSSMDDAFSAVRGADPFGAMSSKNAMFEKFEAAGGDMSKMTQLMGGLMPEKSKSSSDMGGEMQAAINQMLQTARQGAAAASFVDSMTVNKGVIYGDEIRALQLSDRSSMPVADGMLVKNDIGGVNFVPYNSSFQRMNRAVLGPDRLSEQGIKAALKMNGLEKWADDKESAAYRVAAKGGAITEERLEKEQEKINQEKEDSKNMYEKIVGKIADSGIPGISQLASGIEILTVDMQEADSWGDVFSTTAKGVGTLVTSAGAIFPEAQAAGQTLYSWGELAEGNYSGAADTMTSAGKTFLGSNTGKAAMASAKEYGGQMFNRGMSAITNNYGFGSSAGIGML